MEKAFIFLDEFDTSQVSFICDEDTGSQDTLSGAPGAGFVAFRKSRLAAQDQPTEF